MQGEVDASILLVFGQYARLENISLDGKFLQTEKFTVAGVETVHEAGQPVGNLMQSWRALRQSQPGAISRLKVWQSPTATVDGVVYSSMQAEEAARFPMMMPIVDSLRTFWTEQAMMANYAYQCIQACVPASCKPLSQVTDTGFSQPAKAAARKFHDQLRRQLAMKARQERAGNKLRVGVREIALTAQVMHDRMVELNEANKTAIA